MATSVPRIEEAPDVDWDAEEAEAESHKSKHKRRTGRRGCGATYGDDGRNFSSDQGDIDPLVAIMMKDEVVELCSSLVAKLELIRYDEERSTVFRIPWISDLFHSCTKRLSPENMQDFNIETWYNDVVTKSTHQQTAQAAMGRGRGGPDYRFSPAVAQQSVQTNWLHPLFELEVKAPGFLKLFFNHLELEEKTQSKLAKGAKDETEYNWIQSGSMNMPAPLLALEGPRTETSGGIRYITQGPSTRK